MVPVSDFLLLLKEDVPQKEVYRYSGGFTYYPKQSAIEIKGEDGKRKVKLTPTEDRVFNLLAINSGKHVSKETIW